MVEYFVEDIFDHLLLKCSWQRWYVCGACIGNELLYFCTRSSLIDVVLGVLQVYKGRVRDSVASVAGDCKIKRFA